MRHRLLLGVALTLLGVGTADGAGATALGPATPVVIALGDSITAGSALASPLEAWPAQAAELSAGAFEFANEGISGDFVSSAPGSIPSANVRPPSMLARLGAALQQHPAAVVLLGGTNDVLHGVEAPAVEAAIAAIAEETAAAGAQLIVSTIPPAEGKATRFAKAEPVRLEVNAWIRAHFSGDHLIDFYDHLAVHGRLPAIDQARGDGIHPSAAEEGWFASEVVQDLNELGV